jgi:hypothetical protein
MCVLYKNYIEHPEDSADIKFYHIYNMCMYLEGEKYRT